jgi:hypothetical protein
MAIQIFGALGNVAAAFLFLGPAFTTMRSIVKHKCTGLFSPLPYIVSVVGGCNMNAVRRNADGKASNAVYYDFLGGSPSTWSTSACSSATNLLLNRRWDTCRSNWPWLHALCWCWYCSFTAQLMGWIAAVAAMIPATPLYHTSLPVYHRYKQVRFGCCECTGAHATAVDAAP